MRIGVVFPQTDIGADPGGVRAFAQAVQQLGYQHLEAYDHVVGADPAHYVGWSGSYDKDSLFHEPMVLFGYLAALCPGLELVSSVIILPQRQAVLTAKQAAQVDVLSNGNFRFGVGIGWNAVEYEALGMDFGNRGRRFEEQIELMRRLWTEPVVTYAGRYHRVTAAGLNPLPIQRPIPVWIGASAEPAIKRAAELGDGYFPLRPLEGGWPATIDRLRGWLHAAGRDPSRFGIDARIQAATGTPDDWRRAAEQWRALGATHLTVVTLNAGLRGPDAHIERVRQALPAVTA
ncbi:MAG: LLM class F420-dependent oxidoreductase [Chloroflexota bacterium]|nr:LLM class F420-dependent oxidoreductase [Chloroflexota bacterium]